MPQAFGLDEIGRLPAPGDNVAVAVRTLAAGTRIDHGNTQFELDDTVLEGHRFAVRRIACGQPLLSWALPFGIALEDIAPGVYVRNSQMLESLRLRNLSFALPARPNFEDRIDAYRLDEARFKPGVQAPRSPHTRTFRGYRRSPARGVGTRNHIVILGVTSRTGSFVTQLAARLKGAAAGYRNIDGIVAAGHTEGGGAQPNNRDLLLRSLSGLMVNANVGAVLAVDDGAEAVDNRMLQHHMAQQGCPIHEVLHRFLTLRAGFQDSLAEAETIVKGWLDAANRSSRTEASVEHLKIALQCGGSDAFSGISGNPLVSRVAREIIRCGGAANLAETNELMGAEHYILQNVKDLQTARKFLAMIERYKALAGWHGATAEGNPSGGNKFRGLYNIVLKSIGAAQKRHPDVRLDGAIDYGEPMPPSGFYFMDSPGNDPESIAGQVASGCNLICFVTGNGAITNFPFVPTIKVLTTTSRYELLSRDMDVNAGAYLDGTPMADLADRVFALTLDVASGSRTKGETAGHSQLSIWRDWKQTDARNLDRLLSRPRPAGKPHPVQAGAASWPHTFEGIRTATGYTTDRIGLILPGSICSGQVGRLCAERLNRKGLGRQQGISRFVALAHTEGCGMAEHPSEGIYNRTVLGYLAHPLVHCALVLEHGCEKTHNDYIRHELESRGIAPEAFGWASIQLDGGIEAVMQKVEDWFVARLAKQPQPEYGRSNMNALCLGLHAVGPITKTSALSLGELTRDLVGAGATVVLPDTAALLTTPAYLDLTVGNRLPKPTLAYGQPPETPGFHIMESLTNHWVETLTGLGATGVEILLAHTGEHPAQGHSMLPMLQVSGEASVLAAYGDDIDLSLNGDTGHNAEGMRDIILRVASRDYTPKALAQGNTDFQITRGHLGVSM